MMKQIAHHTRRDHAIVPPPAPAHAASPSSASSKQLLKDKIALDIYYDKKKLEMILAEKAKKALAHPKPIVKKASAHPKPTANNANI